MKNKIIKSLIFSVSALFLAVLWMSPAKAMAATTEFSNTPLFGESNFAPGNSITDRYIKINNETGDTHSAIIKAFDVINSGGLGDVTNLQIKDGSDILYDNTFSDFFSQSEVVLPQIGAGESKTFYLIVTFDPSAGNSYQNSTMSFGIEAGLDDGDTGTDTTVISGGGSSIVLGNDHLVVSNENSSVTVPPAPATGNNITITWDTNIPATSQVVYGLSSGGPYTLNLSDVNFGYPSSTPEQDLGKVVNHKVVLSNLTTGTYSYRVVSRASPPTVGYEHYFNVSENQTLKNQVNNNPTNNSLASNLGLRGNIEPLNLNNGNNTNSNANQQDNKILNDNTNNLGASAGKILGFSNFWFYFIISLLILLIIFFFFLWRKKKKEKEE